ncbi:MAG: hypothetical protein WA864_09815 [Acetobacteraceae bacterium]
MMTVSQKRVGLRYSSARLPDGGATGRTVGSGTRSSGRPSWCATCSRASAKRPLAVSHRTDSGTTSAIATPTGIVTAPSIATPRQPSNASNVAAVAEASSAPAVANTT